MGKNEAWLDDKPKLHLAHSKMGFIQISGHFEQFCCGTNMKLTHSLDGLHKNAFLFGFLDSTDWTIKNDSRTRNLSPLN